MRIFSIAGQCEAIRDELYAEMQMDFGVIVVR
jgi:hypothetical protein